MTISQVLNHYERNHCQLKPQLLNLFYEKEDTYYQFIHPFYFLNGFYGELI